jgi:hypothetical protein
LSASVSVPSIAVPLTFSSHVWGGISHTSTWRSASCFHSPLPIVFGQPLPILFARISMTSGLPAFARMYHPLVVLTRGESEPAGPMAACSTTSIERIMRPSCALA